MNSLVRLFVLITVSFVFGFYCIPTGLAQAKSAGGKTIVTGCLQKGDEAMSSRSPEKMARRMVCGVQPLICPNIWAIK